MKKFSFNLLHYVFRCLPPHPILGKNKWLGIVRYAITPWVLLYKREKTEFEIFVKYLISPLSIEQPIRNVK